MAVLYIVWYADSHIIRDNCVINILSLSFLLLLLVPYSLNVLKDTGYDQENYW